MRTILVVVGKDLRQHLRNGTLLLFALVLPLGTALLFSGVLPDPAGFHARYVVADEDGGPAAQAFARTVVEVIGAESAFDVSRAGSGEAARALVAAGDADAALVIPAGFSADLQAGRDAALEVVGAAEAPIAAYVAREIALGYFTELRGAHLAVALTEAAGVPVADPERLAEQVLAQPPPLSVTRSATADRGLGTATYYSAGMAAFFVFFVAMLSVQNLLNEHGGGTMARMLAAPAPRAAILAGKVVSGVLTGITSMAVLVTGSTLLLGARWGSPLAVAALALALVLAATGVMFLVATFAGRPEHATGWTAPLAVLLGMFGGSFAPLAQLGGLAVVSYATPHRWFLQGVSDLAAAGPTAVVTPVAVLLGLAAATLGLTGLRAGRLVRS